jgi:hypothetical protein
MRNPYTGRVSGDAKQSSSWVKIGLVFLLAIGLMFAAAGLFYPWIFFAGGHWHVLPQWSGWGRFSVDGKSYALYISVVPRPSGSRIYSSTSLRGSAIMCGPDGERVHLGVRAGMIGHLPLDVRGQPIRLTIVRRSVWAPWYEAAYEQAGQPQISLQGKWIDGGIDASGTLRRTAHPTAPVAVRFQEAVTYGWWPDCPALE